MTIEEKPRALEFKCIIKNIGDSKTCKVYDITYDPKEIYPISIITGDNKKFKCPVELFEEVTSYLQSKGIIKSKVLSKASNSQKDRTLPVPVIEGEENSGENIDDNKDQKQFVSNVDPLASFDILETTPSVKKDKFVNVVKQGDEIEEDIDRIVIRSRVKGEDLQSAEKEAQTIRGVGKSGKIIKKKHVVE